MDHIEKNNNRISKYFNLPPLRQLEQEENLAQENTCYATLFPMIQPNYIFGIEVETEGISLPKMQYKYNSYWNITQDNSLRNNGYEFVSLPLKAKYLECALQQLNKSLPTTTNFSPRTSVHVHMNVRDLTIEQISCLTLLYITCENLLFDWVGHDRNKSVFCIPLLETDYRKILLDLLTDTHQTIHHWNKYTALNLHPIQTIGTVEFRHMEGNNNIARILMWINFLSCLKAYTKTTTIHRLLKKIMDLNSSSNYIPFLQEVFKDLSMYLLRNKTDEEIQQSLEEAVSYIKTAYNYKEKNTYKASPRQNQIEWVTLDPATIPMRNEPIDNILDGGAPPTTAPMLDDFDQYMRAFREAPIRTSRPSPFATTPTTEVPDLNATTGQREAQNINRTLNDLLRGNN